MSISSPFSRFFNTLSDRLAISDPAFLHFNRLCVSLLLKLSPDPCQSNQTKSKESLCIKYSIDAIYLPETPERSSLFLDRLRICT
jgi:hypothetical protein